MTRLVFKYGAYFFLGLLGYFLFMRALGLSENFDFRIFNALIQSIILFFSIKAYALKYSDEFNYLTGTIAGMKTTLVGVLPFAIIQTINLYINPSFLEMLKDSAPVVGPYLSPVSAGFIILAEGLAAGLIISYLCMRIVDWKVVPANKPFTKSPQ